MSHEVDLSTIAIGASGLRQEIRDQGLNDRDYKTLSPDKVRGLELGDDTKAAIYALRILDEIGKLFKAPEDDLPVLKGSLRGIHKKGSGSKYTRSK